MDNLAVAKLPPNAKNGMMASFGDDTGAHVTFDDEFVKNDYKSECEGRVCYDHFFVMEMQWPGDNTKTFKYRFSPDQTRNEYTERFPRQWTAFKDSKEQTPDGTPIEMWPPLDKKRVFELKANKIYTVEQISSVKDTDVQSALGLEGRKLRDLAIAFLNPSASTAQLSKLSRDNEDLQHQIEAMKQQLASMNGNVHSMQATPLQEPKKRGRKPKIQPTEAA